MQIHDLLETRSNNEIMRKYFGKLQCIMVMMMMKSAKEFEQCRKYVKNATFLPFDSKLKHGILGRNLLSQIFETSIKLQKYDNDHEIMVLLKS